MEGTVKWYNVRKGYGFVKGEDGEDYFVHHTALGRGVFLRENDLVSFEPAETEKGKQAQDVQLLKKGSERDDVQTDSEETAEEVEESQAEEFDGEEESSEEAPAEEATEESTEEESTEEAEEAPAEEESEEKEE